MRNLAIKLFGSVVAACIGGFILFGTPAYAADTTIAIDSTNFPDANFRSFVETNYDADNSGYLDDTSLTETIIDVHWQGITDLTGIEHFPALESLDCEDNQLTSLDLTSNPALENLNCGYNPLVALDVTGNPALRTLYCENSNLAALDVTQNPALVTLRCYSNNLAALDVTQNPALVTLSCGNNNLATLDVTQNPALESLHCYSNNLTALDVTQNPALGWLECSGNQLAALDVTHNPALVWFDCSGNQLAALDVTNNPALTTFYCENNQLAALDVTNKPALLTVYCYNNNLAALDVTNNPALIWLICYDNQLYDIIGVSASPGYNVWAAASQSLTISVFPDPANPGSYISASSYPLSSGHTIVLASGAAHNAAAGSFSAAALNTPYAFTTTTAAGTITGTITFVLGPPPMPPVTVTPVDPPTPAPPSALPNTGDAAVLPLALAVLCALLGSGAVVATRRNAARRQRTGSHSR